MDFFRGWNDYKRGFGDVEFEHWLGNQYIHRLTSRRSYTLRIDLEDWNGRTAYATYSNFSIDSEANGYRLTVSGYSGIAGRLTLQGWAEKLID